MIAMVLMAAEYVAAGPLKGNRGGGSFQNQGVASGGNFSAKRSNKNGPAGKKAPTGTKAQQPKAKATTGAQKNGAKPSKTATGNAQQPKAKTTTGTAQQAQTKSQTNQQNRQQAIANNQDARQDAVDDWDNDDCLTENCNGGAILGGMAIGAATAAIVTQPSTAAPPPPPTTTTTTETTTAAEPANGLPCEPTVEEIEGVTYYACDQDYYILAYGAAGPAYTPVPSPH